MTTGCSSLYTERDARHLKVFNFWLMAGMGCFFAATVLLSEKIIDRGPLAYALCIATVVLMSGATRAYVIFLRGADELVRKIQVEALSMSFGAAAIFMIGWRLAERLGAPRLDVDDPFIIMVIVWGVGQWAGYRRYGMVGGGA